MPGIKRREPPDNTKGKLHADKKKKTTPPTPKETKSPKEKSTTDTSEKTNVVKELHDSKPCSAALARSQR